MAPVADLKTMRADETIVVVGRHKPARLRQPGWWELDELRRLVPADVAAADPDLEWESIPGVVVELDVLWRSWAHAWSGAGSLYDRREWLDYLPRAVDHMARLVAGWNESAGMESSRAACSLATSGAGSLGLVPGALRWANTKPSRAAGALLRWRGRSRCLARRCIGLWRLFTIESVGGV